jgi:hypothetical protein
VKGEGRASAEKRGFCKEHARGLIPNVKISKLSRPSVFDHFTGGVNKPAPEANEIIHQWLLK